MRNTHHMIARMQQRNLPAGAVALTLGLGDWDGHSERVSVGCRDLDDFINELRRALKDAERLRRRGGATTVLDGETLITTYDRSGRGRR